MALGQQTRCRLDKDDEQHEYDSHDEGRPSQSFEGGRDHLHHHAYVVADQERTRHFYEAILGMPLVATWCEQENLRGKEREYCHTFFALADGSALAFFQFAEPDDHAELFAATPQSLNHVALAVDAAGQDELIRRLDAHEIRYARRGDGLRR